MMYAPHTLYKKSKPQIKLDSFGKPIPSCREAEWERLFSCRCDDDDTQWLVSDNGQEYKSSYHVVYDKSDAIVEGDEIRCLTLDGKVKGQGVVGMVKTLNYLNYSELWM